MQQIHPKKRVEIAEYLLKHDLHYFKQGILESENDLRKKKKKKK